MANWAEIPAHYIAFATDAHGGVHGFTTPPRFHGPTGQWQATAGGKKERVWLAAHPPGESAGQTVEYRPGHDPVERGGQRPAPFGVEISGSSDALGLANLEAIAKATGRTLDEVRDPKGRSSIEPVAPVRPQAPKITESAIAHVPVAGPKIVEHVETSAPADPAVGAGALVAVERPTTPFVLSAPTQGTTTMASDSHSIALRPGDVVPARLDNTPMLCPPSFYPAPAPNGWPPVQEHVLVQLTKPNRREEKLVEALDMILDFLKHQWGPTEEQLTNHLAAAQALVDSLKPAPALTDAERDVVRQLEMLDSQAKQMLAQGKTQEWIDTIQGPMRSFLAGIKEERDAKIAKGAKP